MEWLEIERKVDKDSYRVIDTLRGRIIKTPIFINVNLKNDKGETECIAEVHYGDVVSDEKFPILMPLERFTYLNLWNLSPEQLNLVKRLLFAAKLDFTEESHLHPCAKDINDKYTRIKVNTRSLVMFTKDKELRTIGK